MIDLWRLEAFSGHRWRPGPRAAADLDRGRSRLLGDGSGALPGPAEAGLAEWFDEGHADATDRPDDLRLVAVLDGGVVGFVLATLQRPATDPERQLVRGLDRPRVFVAAVADAASHQRPGIGSALMTEVERWAHVKGAERVVLDTHASSPLSVPFYGQKLGYTRHFIVFHKRLS